MKKFFSKLFNIRLKVILRLINKKIALIKLQTEQVYQKILDDFLLYLQDEKNLQKIEEIKSDYKYINIEVFIDPKSNLLTYNKLDLLKLFNNINLCNEFTFTS